MVDDKYVLEEEVGGDGETEVRGNMDGWEQPVFSSLSKLNDFIPLTYTTLIN